jgi:hypothetical protein
MYVQFNTKALSRMIVAVEKQEILYICVSVRARACVHVGVRARGRGRARRECKLAYPAYNG